MEGGGGPDCRLVEGKRWLDGGLLPANIALVTEEVAAVSTHFLVKFIFLRSGKSRLYQPGADSDGVGVMAGRDDLGLLGWCERSTRPRVFVYQYNNPLELKVLRGEALMEYRSLTFSHETFLLGVSGVPDFMVNLWDWQNETLLTAVSTGLEGPASASVKLISSAFPPDSGAGMAKMFLTMWAGRAALWDIEKVSASYNIARTELTVGTGRVIAFTWLFPADCYLLDNNAAVWRLDPASKEVTQLLLDLGLQERLDGMELKPCEFQLKAHYDGMAMFTPGWVFLLSLGSRKEKLSLVASVQTDLTLIALTEFHSAYRYIGWSHEGRLVTVSTTERTASIETALKNDPWVKYNAACFVPKFLSFFLTVDKYNMLRLMDTHYKRELWRRQLGLEVVSMVPFPHIPSVICGTMEGRMLFLTADVPTQSIDFEEEEEALKVKVNVKFVGDILIHKNPIDNMQIDPKTLLCVAVSNEEGVVAVVDVKNITKTFFLDEVTVEGSVLDVHLQGRNLVVLSGDEEEAHGDLITLIKIDSKKRSLTVANVFNLAAPCSGLALSENGRFFFSVQHTDKQLGKFPLSEEEQAEKVEPLSTRPSQHGLPVHTIQTTAAGLALLGRDGLLSIHSTTLAGPVDCFHLQHYQAAGVIDAHIAANGNILSVSGEGTLTMFQRKDPLEANAEVDKQTLTGLQKMSEVDIETPEREKLSWSEKRTLEQKESERKKYEIEINTISDTVERMAEQVSRLLNDNDSLPNKDQLDRRQFELDVEEQARQVAEGEDKVCGIIMIWWIFRFCSAGC